MKLYEFRDKTKNRVDDFFYWWNKKRRYDKNNYPLEMNEADWREQFELWEDEK